MGDVFGVADVGRGTYWKSLHWSRVGVLFCRSQGTLMETPPHPWSIDSNTHTLEAGPLHPFVLLFPGPVCDQWKAVVRQVVVVKGTACVWETSEDQRQAGQGPLEADLAGI